MRSGRGCVDLVFLLKQLSKKYGENRKELYVVLMENVYGKVYKEHFGKGI